MVRLEQIEAEVLKELGITREELRSRERSTRLVVGRQVFVWLARTHTCDSYPDIAKYMGKQSHSGSRDQLRLASSHIMAGRKVCDRTLLDMVNSIEKRLGLPESKRPRESRGRKHFQVNAA